MKEDKNVKKKNKELIIEGLKKTPIIQLVCEKVGIARSSFYRWHKKDKKFSEEVDKAIIEGNHMINDMAESQLLSAIKDRNMTGIIFWLKNHHRAYADKLRLSGKIKTENEKLNPEQEETLRRAIELAGIDHKKEREEKDE
jgi:hypothetical protein